jgi:hypothetical protein
LQQQLEDKIQFLQPTDEISLMQNELLVAPFRSFIESNPTDCVGKLQKLLRHYPKPQSVPYRFIHALRQIRAGSAGRAVQLHFQSTAEE